MEDQEHIRELIEFLRRKKSSKYRDAVLRELSKYKSDPLVAEAAVYALGDASNSGTKELADSIIIEIGEAAFPAIMEALQSKSWRFPRNILLSKSLIQVGGSKAVDLLIKILRHDKHASVRSGAALALGRINDRRAIDHLIAALGDPSTRLAVAQALSEFDAPSGSLRWKEVIDALKPVVAGF